MEPAVSNDRSRIAFRAIKDGNSDIYIVDKDGTNPERITDWESMEGQPSWSPDGKMLSFFSNKGGNFNIYLIDLQTKDIQQMTDNSNLNLISFWLTNPDTLFYTSNGDGDEVRSVALGSGQDTQWSNAFEHHNPIKPSMTKRQLWGVVKDGKDWELATFTPGQQPTIMASSPSRDSEPTPSPNEKTVIFTSKRGQKNSWQLYQMNWDGSDITQLTDSEGRNAAPSWISNQEVLFSSNREGTWHLYIIDIGSKKVRRLEIDW